jgi:hypothetical protein
VRGDTYEFNVTGLTYSIKPCANMNEKTERGRPARIGEQDALGSIFEGAIEIISRRAPG